MKSGCADRYVICNCSVRDAGGEERDWVGWVWEVGANGEVRNGDGPEACAERVATGGSKTVFTELRHDERTLQAAATALDTMRGLYGELRRIDAICRRSLSICLGLWKRAWLVADE